MRNDVRDGNGNLLRPRIARDRTTDGRPGWGVTLWSGGLYGFGTNVVRRVYANRETARNADISCLGEGYLGKSITPPLRDAV